MGGQNEALFNKTEEYAVVRDVMYTYFNKTKKIRDCEPVPAQDLQLIAEIKANGCSSSTVESSLCIRKVTCTPKEGGIPVTKIARCLKSECGEPAACMDSKFAKSTYTKEAIEADKRAIKAN